MDELKKYLEERKSYYHLLIEESEKQCSLYVLEGKKAVEMVDTDLFTHLLNLADLERTKLGRYYSVLEEIELALYEIMIIEIGG